MIYKCFFTKLYCYTPSRSGATSRALPKPCRIIHNINSMAIKYALTNSSRYRVIRPKIKVNKYATEGLLIVNIRFCRTYNIINRVSPYNINTLYRTKPEDRFKCCFNKYSIKIVDGSRNTNRGSRHCKMSCVNEYM